MVLQDLRVAPIRDGVEVQTEGLGFREEQRRQSGDPPGQQPLLLRAFGAVRVVGGVALLRKDVQTGEQTESLVEVEVADMAAALFVQQFQDQQA
jgi:hypothetical protein